MVGKEAIDELRERVKLQLYEKVEERVRTRCNKFVKDGSDVGIGVKSRILEFLDDLTDAVIEAASPVAIKVLTNNYEQVALEITAALKKHRNPIDTAFEEIVDHNEKRLLRTDARARRKVLDEADRVLASLPVMDVPVGTP